MTTWARIEARSYEEAVELLEKLSGHPAALVEDTEYRWSIYISGDAAEMPTVIRSAGVDPVRVELVDALNQSVDPLCDEVPTSNE